MSLDWFSNLSPQLATFLLAMLPITELRASIPIALGSFGMSIEQAFLWSVLGSLVPALIILYLLTPLLKIFRRFSVIDKFFTWLFDRTRRKFEVRYALWGKVALVFFVAVPLPGTGVWTGSLVAWIFGFKKLEALILISLGALIAGILVSILSIGVVHIADLI